MCAYVSLHKQRQQNNCLIGLTRSHRFLQFEIVYNLQSKRTSQFTTKKAYDTGLDRKLLPKAEHDAEDNRKLLRRTFAIAQHCKVT